MSEPSQFIDDSPIGGSSAGLPSNQGIGSGYAPRGQAPQFNNSPSGNLAPNGNAPLNRNLPRPTPVDLGGEYMPPGGVAPSPYKQFNTPVPNFWSPANNPNPSSVAPKGLPPSSSGRTSPSSSPNPSSPSSTSSNPYSPNPNSPRNNNQSQIPPPNFEQNPPVPPGRFDNNGGAPAGEAGLLGELPPSGFDQYFNDFFDNFYGGQIEPPGEPPPFQGGQVPGQLYRLKYKFVYNIFNNPLTEIWPPGDNSFLDGEYYGPIEGTFLARQGGQWKAFLRHNGERYRRNIKETPIRGPGGSSTFISHQITLIVPFNPPPGFIDQSQYTPPGTTAPPNTNFTPSGLLGLAPGSDLGDDTGLDSGQSPTNTPPALDPTQHPATYNPPTPYPPDQVKPLPPNLESPSNNPYTGTNTTGTNAGINGSNDPFGNRSYGNPSSSSSTSTTPSGGANQGIDLNKSPTNTPTNTIDPNTGKPAPVTETPTDPNAPNNPTDPCQVKLNNKLDKIDRNTEDNNQTPVNIQGILETKRCSEIRETPPSPDDPDEQTFNYSGQGFLGIAEQIKALSKQVEAVRKYFCHVKSTLSIPDAWNLKTQPNRPQLIVVYAEVKYENGQKKLGKSRWSFTIPHFNESKRNNLNLPDYKKGYWMAISELKDGSKIVINATNEATAIRICKLALSYVEASMQTPAKDIKVTPRKGKISSKLITPVLAHYYPQGRGLNSQGELKPSWTIQLRTREND